MKEDKQMIARLHDLLDYDARKIIDAEIELKNVLPVWMQKTLTLKLHEILEKYSVHINRHIEQIGGFFAEERMFAITPHNKVMRSFIENMEEKLAACSTLEVKEACLLASIQEINHFKISMYGTAAAFAKTLEMNDAASLFYEAEINEKQIDDRLSQLAEHEINVNAKSPSLISE